MCWTGILMQLQPELQRVEQRMIEAKIVNPLTQLPRESKMPLVVRRCRAQHRTPLWSAIRHCHIWNRSTYRIKNDAFDSLGGLRLLNNHNFSNRARRSDQQY